MKYDVLIIGGGPGGYTAAFEAVNAKNATALLKDQITPLRKSPFYSTKEKINIPIIRYISKKKN